MTVRAAPVVDILDMVLDAIDCRFDTLFSSKTTRAILIGAVLSTCSCASVPEGPKVVSVPVAVSCVPADTPAPPGISIPRALLALDDHRLVLTIAAERLDLIAWVRKIEPVLQACRE